MTIWDALRPFEHWLTASGYRERTVRVYRKGVLAFASHWGRRPLAAVDFRAVEAWMEHLHQEGYAHTTRRAHLTALRQFGAWCVRQGIWPTNHADLVRYPRGARRLPEVPARAEVERILRHLERQCRRTRLPWKRAVALRDRAMVEIAYASALRASEVVGLRVEDVDLDQRSLVVHNGKGGRPGRVPFHDAARDALREYLREGRPVLLNGQRCAALFLTATGRPARYETFRDAFRQAVRQAGATGPGLRPHGLRHRAATDCWEATGDPRTTAEYLRHANMATVMVYTHVSPAHLRRWYDQAHPRARPAAVPNALL